MRKPPATTLSGNGPPPDTPVSLYVGEVMHARLKPVGHRFSYAVFTLLLDLDRLAEADRASPLLSIGRRFNLVSVDPRDHGPRDGSCLAAHARRLAAGATGLPEAAFARVLMLAYPRILGQVFNPLTVYFALSAEGAPLALLYEVRNTFGGMHTYALPVAAGEAGPAGIRQRQDKGFFVSPFIAMEESYAFRVMPPGRSVKVRILESDAGGPLLSATFNGRREAVSTARLARLVAGGRMFPFKVLGAIHLEAVRLLLKGVKGLPIPRTAKRTTTSLGGPSGGEAALAGAGRGHGQGERRLGKG